MEEVISFNEFELDQIIAGLREELQKDFQCKKKGEGGGLGSYKPRQNQIPEDESSPAQKKHKKIDELPSAKKIPKRSYENTIDDHSVTDNYVEMISFCKHFKGFKDVENFLKNCEFNDSKKRFINIKTDVVSQFYGCQS